MISIIVIYIARRRQLSTDYSGFGAAGPRRFGHADCGGAGDRDWALPSAGQ